MSDTVMKELSNYILKRHIFKSRKQATMKWWGAGNGITVEIKSHSSAPDWLRDSKTLKSPCRARNVYPTGWLIKVMYVKNISGPSGMAQWVSVPVTMHEVLSSTPLGRGEEGADPTSCLLSFAHPQEPTLEDFCLLSVALWCNFLQITLLELTM